MIAVDGIIISLLPAEREPIKEYKTEMLRGAKFGLDGKVEVYDSILEKIIDSLEDAGFLTKDFVVETFTGEIPGIDD